MLCHGKKPGDLTYPLSPRFLFEGRGLGWGGVIYDVSVFMKSYTWPISR